MSLRNWAYCFSVNSPVTRLLIVFMPIMMSSSWFAPVMLRRQSLLNSRNAS